ncbi:MAG: type I-U CRISPR-associated protein Cas5/Cas6, partial [Boseongicola sp. SB0675_bin_26]|nr:type I-U CRISPR-associated protein Cas5/Cas6 [Boseongicola sp. SB0675_bin_26]
MARRERGRRLRDRQRTGDRRPPARSQGARCRRGRSAGRVEQAGHPETQAAAEKDDPRNLAEAGRLMFTVSLEFLHCTFRGDPDGTANTGRLDHGEWPPAPARLFAAFVASDGSGENCRITDGSELRWLESLPPPVIRAVPDVHHQPLLPRYVVRHEGKASGSTHQEHVGRTGTLVRAGVRVAPRDSRVVYEWDDEPPPTVLEGLRRRADRIGYLGASDSPVRVAVATGERLPGPSDAFVPDPDGETTIAVPKSGDLVVFDQMHALWTERGASVSRSQFPALRHDAWYRSPTAPKAIDQGGAVAWLALRPAQSGRRVSAVTTLFKEAVLSRHQRLHGEPSPLLHGHGFKQKGYEIARYLALPDVGGRWSRGRLRGRALWLPPGGDAGARNGAR